MAGILYPQAGRTPPLLSHHHPPPLPHSASFFPPCGTAFSFGESVKDLANDSLSAEDVSAIWRIAMIIDDTFIEGGSGGEPNNLLHVIPVQTGIQKILWIP